MAATGVGGMSASSAALKDPAARDLSVDDTDTPVPEAVPGTRRGKAPTTEQEQEATLDDVSYH